MKTTPAATEKRLYKIVICVNENERKHFRMAASAAHLDVASWIRSAAMREAEAEARPRRDRV